MYADSYGDIEGGISCAGQRTPYRGLHFCANTCETMFNLYAGYTQKQVALNLKHLDCVSLHTLVASKVRPCQSNFINPNFGRSDNCLLLCVNLQAEFGIIASLPGLPSYQLLQKKKTHHLCTWLMHSAKKQYQLPLHVYTFTFQFSADEHGHILGRGGGQRLIKSF